MRDLDLGGEGEDVAIDFDPAATALIDAAGEADDVGVDHGAAPEGPAYSPARDDQGRFARGEAASRQIEGTDLTPREPEKKPSEPPPRTFTLAEVQELFKTMAPATRPEQRQPAPQQDQGPDLETLMYQDPAKFLQVMQERQQAAVQDLRFTFMQERAEEEHGDALKEAQAALRETKDERLAASLLSQANPFEALMAWHRREKTLAAVPDGDITKFEAAHAERLLKDPAFLTRALEAARGQAGGQLGGQRQPSNVHRLPSVARTGSAAAAALPDDLSDQDLYSALTGR